MEQLEPFETIIWSAGGLGYSTYWSQRSFTASDTKHRCQEVIWKDTAKKGLKT